MVCLAIGVFEYGLVARIMVVGAECAYKLIIPVDFVGDSHTYACLAVTVAVLPVYIHHPFSGIVVEYHFRTFERAFAGFGVYGLRCFEHQSFAAPVVEVGGGVAADAVAVVARAVFSEPVISAVEILHTTSVGVYVAS